MAAATCRDRATERVAARVEVPRDAAGDLHAGVRTKLARIDGVEVVDVDVVGLEPRLNDLTAEVEATLRLDDVDATGLDDTVGVHDVRPQSAPTTGDGGDGS